MLTRLRTIFDNLRFVGANKDIDVSPGVDNTVLRPEGTQLDGGRCKLRDARSIMTYKPFIIAGMPRSGSTFLLTTIQQHPAILAYGELFHPAIGERSRTHAIRRDGAALYFDAESADPVDFLKRWVWIDGNAGFGAIGFKIFAEYVRAKSTDRLLERLKEEISGLRVLHIRRTNYFDVYISRIVASKTERWIKWPGDDSSSDEIRNVRLVISQEAAESFFRAMARADAYIEKLFHGESYLRVDYKELSQNTQEQANAVFDFLQVDKTPVAPAILKQITARKEDVVVNYRDLWRHFAGTPYESFFASDEDSAPGGVAAEQGLRLGPGAQQDDPRRTGDCLSGSLESLDEAIVSAVNNGLIPMQVPAAAACMHVFVPTEPRFLGTLPKSLAASGNLERVNGVAAPADLSLWRGAAASFGGWSCRMEEAQGRADSRYFFLERGDGQLRYYVHVLSRIQRDDVAGAAPELPNWVTRFSGFDFLADLQHLQPGEYRLGVVHETGGACYEFVFAKRLRVVS